MARKNPTAQQGGEEFDTPGKHVIDTPLSDEVKKSYLEYAYSVIHSRALPDARDGLKPVHRRILYTMYNMGLRPNAPQVKSARVVGDALGRFHPHGDSSVYEALVRMAQPFSLNTPLIDGHGNFGSPNDGAAAMRYTECRLAPPAMLMVGEITENTVDFVPNYDNSLEEPVVLPAAFPNLLVNGTSGIAVGMATNMIPHNLKEVIAATRHLLAKPDSTVDDLMQFLPGPDLPTGGQILGADQVKEAYRTGKGTVRIRAKVTVEPIEGSRGRNQIVVTELPYQVGTEKVIESIKSEVAKKRLAGVSDVKDLSDRRHGLRLVIECKTGVNPQALLSELYKYTPLETSFGINNLALVDGQPKVLGLVELLSVFLSHRKEVVTRRTQFRLNNAEARAHIVEGLLIALDAVDEVVKTIRASKDTAAAKTSLVKKFKLSDIQASHILEMPLRKLVNLEVVALRKEQKELAATIKHLKKILSDAKTMNALIDSELANVVENFGVDRQSELVDGDLKDILEASSPAGPVVIPDEPCIVLFSSTGLLARTVAPSEEPPAAGRGVRHAAVRTSPIVSTTRGQVLAVTNTGRAFKVDTINLPPVPTGKQLSLRGGVSGKEIVPLQPNERIVTVVPLTTEGKGIALGTKEGKVKICAPDWPSRGEEFTVISLTGGDEVVGAGWVNEDGDRLAFVSSDSSLLTYDAKNVRAQGRSGGGMSGVKLAAGKHVVFFGVVSGSDMSDAEVITYTGHSAKKAKFVDYPTKGRGTGGVRSHKFLKGEDTIVDAWIGKNPTAGKENGTMVELPKTVGKRDGSGVPQEPFDVLGGSVTDGEVKTLTVVPPAAATETPE